MLKRRASCLSLFPPISSQFTLEVCAATEDRKNNKTPYFWSLRPFKVINVDKTEKLVTSACYDRQNAHAYLQRFYARKQLLLSARLSHRNSACPFVRPFVRLSVCQTGGSVKNGAN